MKEEYTLIMVNFKKCSTSTLIELWLYSKHEDKRRELIDLCKKEFENETNE